ncbi:hypothetical protein CR162_06725 [Pseudoroseomonas rhizosphaerae]|uniref:Plasmid recombination enzyme n=1 Tax=Teichococcus rhizosphaerae TaxID=1335062 RepID=A0A2C7A624_9PROT|nr:hypothetical protein [Pseudoroseomonas rhizosphaerae]PHK95548.1 hypothetical protein CR162_06725 [Pseudoroseomonas rhizosphaerae]
MAGPQFLRIETFGRVPTMRRHGKHKGTRHGADTKFLFAELRSDRWASTHLKHPRQEPVVLWGLGLHELEAAHDTMVALATEETKAGVRKSISVAQHTVAGVILSHKGDATTLPGNLELRASVESWEQTAIAWLQVEYGADLASVVRHWDEDNPHIHGILLPQDPCMRATLLHPGAVAKKETYKAAIQAGEDPRTAGRLAHTAYRQALADLQDRYHAEVGFQHGMERRGPRRPRYTSAEYKSRKAEARHQLELSQQLADKALSRVATERQRTLVARAERNLAMDEAAQAKKEVTSLQAQLAELQAALNAVRKAISLP